MNELQQRIFSLKGEDVPFDKRDRRREPRVQESRLVHVQPADLAGEQFEEVRNMRDFSRSGIYFITDRPTYEQGNHLHVVPSFGCLNLEYLGEVVRVDELPFGEYGIAVHLLRVENLVAGGRTAVMAAFEAFSRAESAPEDTAHDVANAAQEVLV